MTATYGTAKADRDGRGLPGNPKAWADRPSTAPLITPIHRWPDLDEGTAEAVRASLDRASRSSRRSYIPAAEASQDRGPRAAMGRFLLGKVESQPSWLRLKMFQSIFALMAAGLLLSLISTRLGGAAMSFTVVVWGVAIILDDALSSLRPIASAKLGGLLVFIGIGGIVVAAVGASA